MLETELEQSVGLGIKQRLCMLNMKFRKLDPGKAFSYYSAPLQTECRLCTTESRITSRNTRMSTLCRKGRHSRFSRLSFYGFSSNENDHRQGSDVEAQLIYVSHSSKHPRRSKSACLACWVIAVRGSQEPLATLRLLASTSPLVLLRLRAPEFALAAISERHLPFARQDASAPAQTASDTRGMPLPNY